MNRIGHKLRLVDLDEMTAVLCDAELAVWGTGGQIPIESNVQGFVLRLYGVHRWREVNGYSVAEDDERDVAMPGKVFAWRQPAAAAKVGGIERKIMGRLPIEFGSVRQRLFVEGIKEDQPLYLIGIFGLIPADKQPAE